MFLIQTRSFHPFFAFSGADRTNGLRLPAISFFYIVFKITFLWLEKKQERQCHPQKDETQKLNVRKNETLFDFLSIIINFF